MPREAVAKARLRCVKHVMDQLVPDDIVVSLSPPYRPFRRGKRLYPDGFPGTVAQAEALTGTAARGIKLDAVLELEVDEDALLSASGAAPRKRQTKANLCAVTTIPRFQDPAGRLSRADRAVTEYYRSGDYSVSLTVCRRRRRDRRTHRCACSIAVPSE
jgi:adenylate kinase